MSEAQRVVLGHATYCRKCGKLLEPGTVVRAYPRRDGWAYYCAEPCNRPAGVDPRPKSAGRPTRAQAPTSTPTPNRLPENRELVSLKDLVEVEERKLQTLVMLLQEIGHLRDGQHELQRGLEGLVATMIGIHETLQELVKAVKRLHPSSA